MSRLKTITAVIALGVGASACTTSGAGPLTAANNPSLNSVHQPVVQRTDFVLDLRTDGNGLPASEQDRLAGWLEGIRVGYGDRITVDEPGAYPLPAARQDVARVVGRYGLLLSDAAPVLNGAVPPGAVRVIASRATASVPGCPQWSDPGILGTNNTSSNYGCATNSNIAAMIANPEDLVLGQDGSGNGSASTATRAIRSYRERQPTGREGLPATSTTGNQ